MKIITLNQCLNLDGVPGEEFDFNADMLFYTEDANTNANSTASGSVLYTTLGTFFRVSQTREEIRNLIAKA